MGKLRDENIDFLFKMILSLKDTEECYSLFEDLCTVGEIQEMSRRMLAAKLVYEKNNYSEIAVKTGLSTATICRVKRSLEYGNDGYLTVLRRAEEKK